MNKLALFDFDGTLTTHDSLKEFLKLASGSWVTFFWLYYIRCVFFLIRMKFKKVDSQFLKEKRLKLVLGKKTTEEIDTLSRVFTENRIPQILRIKGREKIDWHINQGHYVIIVSASIDLCLSMWCTQLGIDLITNELVREESSITGRFMSKDCNGSEKLARIKKKIDLQDYAYIYAYGDTVGDLDMLSIADEKYFKPFN